MFQFPGFRLITLCIQMTILASLQVGSPIRTSPSQRLIDNSSGLFAALHVLLRLSSPRHPPIALNLLAFNTKTRYLISC